MPPDRTPPDAELLARTALGDRGAFTILYERHAPRVMAFVSHLLDDRASAEDATQETFVKVWRSAGRFQADRPFDPWLFRIARNEAYDVARRRGSRPAGGPASAQASDLRPAVAPAADDPALSARLRAAVASLSEALRETFVLVRILGRPPDEVAALLGIPAGTVKSRVAAAEADLRRRLGMP